jgi:hypothetical protein
MDQTARVRRVERRGGLCHELGRPRRWQRPALVQQPAEVRSLDPAHRDVEAAVVVACVVDGDHVRVVELRGHARLAHEAGPEPLVARELRRDHLERDDPVELAVAGAIDHAHAAAARDRLDGVAGDLRAEER